MSHSHKLRPIGASTDSPLTMNFEIIWYIDRKHPGSRLRFPTRFSRITDYKGAVRFCHKHGIPLSAMFGPEFLPDA